MRQLELPRWGGRRKGAGRKPGRRPSTPHRARARFRRDQPSHITLRIARDLPNLRVPATYEVLKAVFRLVRQRPGFRLIHYSVQRNHIHLIVEAWDKKTLRSGLAALEIRLALALNRWWKRSGPVFGDRYHNHVIRAPREARHVLAYVLSNARKHAKQAGIVLPRRWLDPYSSARAFPGWSVPTSPPREELPVVEPHAWLLRTAWRRRGPLPIDGIPGDHPEVALPA